MGIYLNKNKNDGNSAEKLRKYMALRKHEIFTDTTQNPGLEVMCG